MVFRCLFPSCGLHICSWQPVSDCCYQAGVVRAEVTVLVFEAIIHISTSGVLPSSCICERLLIIRCIGTTDIPALEGRGRMEGRGLMVSRGRMEGRGLMEGRGRMEGRGPMEGRGRVTGRGRMEGRGRSTSRGRLEVQGRRGRGERREDFPPPRWLADHSVSNFYAYHACSARSRVFKRKSPKLSDHRVEYHSILLSLSATSC